MNLQQRQPSPSEEADLEVTAELPVLDVAAYEASAASAAATGSHGVAANTPRERDPLSATDTWHIPPPALRKAPTSEAANTVIDENRARLEVNLQALSATLRDVEERLTRKGERLIEIEKALELSVAERNVTEQRARALNDEVARAEATSAAAQARVAELQKALHDRQAADEARQARDAEAHAQLLERSRQIEAQLASNGRDRRSAIENHSLAVFNETCSKIGDPALHVTQADALRRVVKSTAWRRLH
jgi:hypothetical protein